MALGALEPKFWERFCAAVERPVWRERQFDRALAPEVDALFRTRTRDAWSALLENADCCAEPVLEPHELFSHPQHAGRGLFVETAGLRLLRTQPALVATERLPRARAPRQGEHQAEVLRDFGITPGGDCG
jgi:crotonobetainyl-CoA:carnitine CoA-transferase CaiB-like acyl-CoA transferase